MEVQSRLGDFLDFFRSKYDADSLEPAWLDRLALVLLTHFEQYGEEGSSRWGALLEDLPESSPNLPLSYSADEQRLLVRPSRGTPERFTTTAIA